MKNLKTKKLSRKICLALACGLVFTAGGQLNKAEAADSLYGAESGTVEGVRVHEKGVSKSVPEARFLSGANFEVFDGNWSYVYGGYISIGSGSETKSVYNNTVTISGGTVSNVLGGRATTTEGGPDVNVYNNIVNIFGGKVTGSVYGGLANSSSGGTASASNNTVTLGNKNGVGTADIGKNVYINFVNSAAAFGGTLNVYNVGNKVGDSLYAPGADINFYVPQGAVSGNTLLTVTNEAKITGAKIHAGVATGSNLKKGDTINLLKATTLTCDETESMAADLTGTGLVKIDGTVKKDGNSIVLTMNEDVSQSLAEESKSLAETRAGGMAFLNSAADMAVGKGFMNAQAAAEAESNAQTGDSGTRSNEAVRVNTGFTPYAAIGGANMTYETGSYVDSKGWGINVGLSRIINNKNSKLTLAPFIEYGKASYDSYLENDVNTHGSGDNSFTGIGFMAKNEQKDGLYYEGSVRLGRSKGDYQGDASTYDSKYDTASNYLAFHAGIGKVQKLNEKSSLDYYGKFFYSHQNGDTVNIQSTLGDASYDFDAINSYRLRLGTRWNQKLSARDVFYAGIAWDYEFDSEARAHYNGMATPAPTMKGSSGMLEIGWKQEATKDNPFGVDLGLTGWCGKQRGVSFNAGFSWAF